MSRVLGFLGLVISLGIGLYFYSAQVKTLSGSGGDSSAAGAAEITAVKGDLIGIANAERGFFASQGKYASLDELSAGKYIAIAHDRPPYTYDVDITTSGFRVTATRDTTGGPAQLWIDETMQIGSSQ
jgi:hypothetical protein